MEETLTQKQKIVNRLVRWRRFKRSNLFLGLISLLGAFILAAYVLFVGTFFIHRPDTNLLEETALQTANELSRVTVSSASFGRIGLCDLSSEENGQRMGINTVYGTLCLNAMIAERLNHPTVNTLLSEDFKSIRLKEKELINHLYQAVKKGTLSPDQTSFFFWKGFDLKGKDNRQTNNFIYAEAYQTLKTALWRRHFKLIDLSIKLGFVRNKLAVSQVLAPPQAANISINEKNEYKSGVPILVPNFDPVMFTTLVANKTSNIDPVDFIQDARLSAPPAVLIEATYAEKLSSSKTKPLIIKKVACAAVGSSPLTITPVAMVVNFPHGLLNLFHSVKDILFYDKWNEPGQWWQAVNGQVPGAGGLIKPPALALQAMTPSDALAVILYHWLRALPPNADVDKCLRLITAHWSNANKTEISLDKAGLPSVNSCLAKDNDARTTIIAEQSYPGGKGQAAINNVFVQDEPNLINSSIKAPLSALPLLVDPSGNCNLAGRKGFDQALVQNFLAAVYDTNLAARGSIATAKLITTKISIYRSVLQEKIMIESQELNSLSSRLTRSNNARIDKQLSLLQAKIRTLQKEIADNENELKRTNHINEQITIALDNANRAIAETYEISQHAFNLCRGGIVLLDQTKQIYLLSKKTCFFAQRQPLLEGDFYISTNLNSSDNPDSKQSISVANSIWLIKGMPIIKDVDALNTNPQFKALSNKILWLFKQHEQIPVFRPICIVLDSKLTTSNNEANPATYSTYPFFNIFIPKNQLFYYCQHAVESGENPLVSWSVLARDLVAYKGETDIGMPINSSKQDWCQKQGETSGTCPGLACEFQLRTPLPKLTDLSIDTSVSNEVGVQMPQLPSVPAEML